MTASSLALPSSHTHTRSSTTVGVINLMPGGPAVLTSRTAEDYSRFAADSPGGRGAWPRPGLSGGATLLGCDIDPGCEETTRRRLVELEAGATEETGDAPA